MFHNFTFDSSWGLSVTNVCLPVDLNFISRKAPLAVLENSAALGAMALWTSERTDMQSRLMRTFIAALANVEILAACVTMHTDNRAGAFPKFLIIFCGGFHGFAPSFGCRIPPAWAFPPWRSRARLVEPEHVRLAS
jgi:hypothetical protein